MAIPPIITNNPIVKLFRSEQKAPDGPEAGRITQQTPEDIVEISEIAQQRLDGLEALSSKDPARLQEVSVQTRDLLAENESLTLGVDPGFQE